MIRRWALVLLLVTVLAPLAACQRREPTPKSACEGLTYTEEGLSREVYLPCAGEILAAMDALRPEVEAAVDGDKEARKRARRAFRTLRKLIRNAGGRNLLEEWSDGRLTDLNVEIWNAYTAYWAAIIAPKNMNDFLSATRSHDEARSTYEGL